MVNLLIGALDSHVLVAIDCIFVMSVDHTDHWEKTLRSRSSEAVTQKSQKPRTPKVIDCKSFARK